MEAEFRLNGLTYTLLKRNDIMVLYGIGGKFYIMKLMLFISVKLNMVKESTLRKIMILDGWTIKRTGFTVFASGS